MKMKKTLISLAILAVSPAAFAQTCGSPIPFNTPAGGPTASGDTCTATDVVSLYCGAQDSVNKPDVIYSVNLAAAGASRTATSITISGAGAGFTPTIFLYTAACATGDGCQQTGEAGFPLDLTTVGAGTYTLAVSASQVDGPNACGTYTITANGTLPVSLKNFSVE
jgi:hypothetical protein